MNFLKTSILSGISTIIRLLSGIVINKIVALYVGPAGIALVGQFQSVFGLVMNFGNGAINSGVTKYVAEYHDEQLKRNQVISASLIITICFSITIGLIVFFFSSTLSTLFLKSREYHLVFKVLGSVLLLISLNSFLLSLLNGLKKIKLFIIVNILGSLLSLVITTALTVKYHLAGALYATVIVQALIFFITTFFIYRNKDIKFNFDLKVGRDVYIKMFSFSLMSIVSVISVQMSQILIRDHLINEFSTGQAGLWQSIWKISEMYLLVLTTAFSTYYLPRLSELKSNVELKKEILSGYKIIIPFVLLSTFVIFIFRDLIIVLLFTSEFNEMRSLFLFQLVGDFLKMTSWTLAFLMIAKAMTKIYIITEIVFALSFYIFSILFSEMFGLVGVTYAYALNYLCYLFVMIFVFRDILFKTQKNRARIENN